MPENPYEPPKHGPERERREWFSAEVVLMYLIGVPIVALVVAGLVFAYVMRLH